MLTESAARPLRQASVLVADHDDTVAALLLIRNDTIDLEGASGAAAACVAQCTAACATFGCLLY